MEQLPSNVYDTNFNIGKYISGGIDLFRKDPGSIFGAFVLTLIFSIIPLFSLLAIGNFYKVCRDVDTNGKADIGKIFNFDDFVPYLKFMLLLFLIVIIIVPIPLIFLPLSLFAGDDGDASKINLAFVIGGFGIFILLYIIFIAVLSVATYYFIPLVALKGSYDVRKNISLSWQLAKRDFFSILIFIVISGFLSQLGFLACGIGIFLTIPIVLCMRYKSFEKIINL